MNAKTALLIETMAIAMVENDSGPRDSELFATHWREFGDSYMESAEVALNAVLPMIERNAFSAGFRRSDNPPPADERIDAAFEYWQASNAA